MNDNEMNPRLARYSRIVDAHTGALAGRDPDTVGIFALLPAIYGAVPGTYEGEIIAALRRGAKRYAAKAEAWRKEMDAIPLEVSSAFVAIAAGGLLILAMYIINRWRK